MHSNNTRRIQKFGEWLRDMRQKRKLPLRVVAAAAQMDSALLSKIELGTRLPTEAQARAFANFFSVPYQDLEAKRVAERFWMEYGTSPAARKAVSLICERVAEYRAPSQQE
jgi:transcriptional regulator with XRE-family HTH domain